MALAVVGGAAGAVALAGWLLQVDGLKSIVPGRPSCA